MLLFWSIIPDMSGCCWACCILLQTDTAAWHIPVVVPSHIWLEYWKGRPHRGPESPPTKCPRTRHKKLHDETQNDHKGPQRDDQGPPWKHHGHVFFCDSLTLVLHVCQIEPVVTKPVRPGFGIDASFDQGVGVHWICHARLLLGLPASHRASQQTARHPFPKKQMNEVNSEWSYVA